MHQGSIFSFWAAFALLMALLKIAPLRYRLLWDFMNAPRKAPGMWQRAIRAFPLLLLMMILMDLGEDLYGVEGSIAILMAAVAARILLPRLRTIEEPDWH